MTSTRPSRNDYEEMASPALVRLILLAMGIAMAMGLLIGIVWTLYHVAWLRWFG